MSRIYVAEAKAGRAAEVAGWVHTKRDLGDIVFVILRDRSGLLQVVAKKGESPEEAIKALTKVPKESVIKVSGKVRASKVAPGGKELVPEKVEVINEADPNLPFDVAEKVKANLETRLEWRVLDLRTLEARAIFRIQSEITKAFREFFGGRDYTEIQPPCIIASASEGGAELFAFPYFEKEALLAQSPQLYKQICALAFEKVFMVVPVFRAEKMNHPTHLNELRQMDIEQVFSTNEDVMKVLEECFVHILTSVKKSCAAELKILGVDLTVPKLPLKRVAYTEAVEALNKRSKKDEEKMTWGADFSKTQEKVLSEIYGDAFFLVDWPTDIKAFYSMPDEKNPKIAKAFDLVYGGIEISSGTQRIHLPDLLTAQLKKKGLDPAKFKYYIDCFKYGAPPHAGWSIGLERLTMSLTRRANIRECCLFPRDRTRLTP